MVPSSPMTESRGSPWARARARSGWLCPGVTFTAPGEGGGHIGDTVTSPWPPYHPRGHHPSPPSRCQPPSRCHRQPRRPTPSSATFPVSPPRCHHHPDVTPLSPLLCQPPPHCHHRPIVTTAPLSPTPLSTTIPLSPSLHTITLYHHHTIPSYHHTTSSHCTITTSSHSIITPHHPILPSHHILTATFPHHTTPPHCASQPGAVEHSPIAGLPTAPHQCRSSSTCCDTSIPTTPGEGAEKESSPELLEGGVFFCISIL